MRPLLHFKMNGTTMQHSRPKPRTLRDFLSDSSISCSSDGFKSFPKNPVPSTTMRSLIEMDLKSSPSWSRNSNPRILNSLLNAVVKRFLSAKSPSILPRSLSRKRRSFENSRESDEIKITVKIKDIIRWTSFRDLPEKEEEEEERPSQPLDFSSSATSSCCSSNGSSWSDSDFTCGYLSSCDGNSGNAPRNDAGAGKTFSPCVGKDSVDATTGKAVWTKDTFTCQEEELLSPVSVLQIGEDEFSAFDQSHPNIERTKQKCMHTIQRFENLTNLDLTTSETCLSVDENISSEEEYDDDNDDNEEQDRTQKRARKLLRCVKATGSVQCSKANLDRLLLDFFRDELKARRNCLTRINDDEDGCEREILRVAKDWIDGSFEYELEQSNKEACVRDMDRRERWSKFEEEKEELVMEIGSNILESLVAELLNEKF